MGRRLPDVHGVVTHDRPVTDADVSIVKKKMAAYRGYYRSRLPLDTASPKMHFLEDDVVPWMQKRGFGMAVHGERGGKAIHKEFNKLARVMFRIKDPLQQLLATMREHLVITDPNVLKEIPQPKKKKLSAATHS